MACSRHAGGMQVEHTMSAAGEGGAAACSRHAGGMQVGHAMSGHADGMQDVCRGPRGCSGMRSRCAGGRVRRVRRH